MQTGDDSAYLLPGRDLQAILVAHVLDAISGNIENERGLCLFASQVVLDVMQQLDAAALEHLARVTIKDLVVKQSPLDTEMLAAQP